MPDATFCGVHIRRGQSRLSLLFSFLTQVKGLLNARHDLRVVKAAIIPQPEVTCAGTGVNVGHLSAVKLGQHERFTLPVFTA